MGCRHACQIVRLFLHCKGTRQSLTRVFYLVSGVAKIRLVDFDYVTLSSLNRHAAAGLADVGTPKVKCLENALKRFSRWIEIDPRIELWKKEDGGSLLEGVDWVIGVRFYCNHIFLCAYSLAPP